jgi:capsular polysaccharide biosynthesis protein
MDKNQMNMQNPEEEISLKELFLALWRQKILIISITLIAAILTGAFSVFVLSPVYHSKLNIVMNMPEIYTTKYGDYTLPLTTNQQYINLITSNNVLVNTMKDMGYDAKGMTLEDLREKITIGPMTATANEEQNSFEVKVAAGNPEEARKLAKSLYSNYVEFLDVMTAEGAAEYYYNDFSVKIRSSLVELETNQKLLEKNEELLSKTPQTINQKEAAKEIKNSAGMHDFVILENIINPNYTQLELDIIENKQMINTIENTIELYKTYLEELDKFKVEIAQYYETGEFTELQSNIVSVSKTNISLPSEPVAPTRKTSPSNTKNVIIGAFLGGMVSVLIALIKEFWFKKETDK